MKHLLSMAVFVTLAVLCSAPTVSALDPGLRCEAVKLKVAGKYGLCRLKAEAKAVKRGAAADYSKCDLYFTSKWGQAESTAGADVCPSEGDQRVVQALIFKHTTAIAVALAGHPPLKHFIDNADGTITDNWTGLRWEKKTELDGSANFAELHDADNEYPWAGFCSANPSKYCQPTAAAATLCAANAEGGSSGCDECIGFEDGTCSATETAWTWAVALNTASFGGATNWRIPRLEELFSIVDYAVVITGVAPLVDVAFDGPGCGPSCPNITDPSCSCTNNWYWSATAHEAFPHDKALIVGYLSGGVSSYFRVLQPGGGLINVRAVRFGL